MTSAPAGAADKTTPKPPDGAGALKYQAPAPVSGPVGFQAMASAPVGAANKVTPKPPAGVDDLEEQAPAPAPGPVGAWCR
jgi:hypothetical protein